ncbi:MAG: NADH-quinone oxidoreductase subunit M, partial [Planctomycetota bacterium]|nr:NADH-quinone oxidoreductase subunit M [Planctomycetota bacterium]
MLSAMIFTPLVGAILTLFIPKDNHKLIRMIATAFAGITLVISFAAWGKYESQSTQLVQLVEGTQYSEGRIDAGYQWFEFGKGEDGKPKSGIYYFVGVDGLSMPLLILTTILSLVAVIISFNIDKRVKEYYFFLLLLEVGMIGVFCALDFFLFYVFWEIMLVPMYFLVGIWGGPKKEFAAIKFFLYTLFGSVFMLIAILAIYFYASPNTFNLLALKEQAGVGPIVAGFQGVVWFALFLGFAIKVPVFPFHTWLPLAHVEAPTAVSIILAGVLLKMGTYGLLRINYAILPRATREFAWLLVLLGLINVVYGAFCALAQKDIK